MGSNQVDANSLKERAALTATQLVPFIASQTDISMLNATLFPVVRFSDLSLVTALIESGVAGVIYSGDTPDAFLNLCLPIRTEIILPNLHLSLPQQPGITAAIWVHIQTDLLSEGHSWKYTDDLIAFLSKLPKDYVFSGIASDSKLANYAKTDSDFDGAYSDMITVMDHVRERLVLAGYPDTKIMVMDDHTPRTQEAFIGVHVLSPYLA
ncbi:MAG: hypothetical protein O3A01_01535 [bacterium]|nr:hypothetical protein [bacterium]